MAELQAWLQEIWAIPMVRDGLRAALIVIGGLLASRFVNRRMMAWSMQSQHRLIARRVIRALILVPALIWAMSEMGLRLGVVLGAAGVVTVAVGFAAQTSVSNMISGVFLMAERPFRIGDLITVAGTTGEVVSIDLLSVKLCTFDNLMVRIPNETMLKANVTNLTHFPIRRYDLKLSIAYKEDLAHVRDVLFRVAENNPLALRNPAPSLLFLAFGNSSVDVQFSAWTTRENYIALRNSISMEVKCAFEQCGIEIPFPQRTLQVGATVQPYLAGIPGAAPPADPFGPTDSGIDDRETPAAPARTDT